MLQTAFQSSLYRLTSPLSDQPDWPVLYQTHQTDQSFIRPTRLTSPLSDPPGWPVLYQTHQAGQSFIRPTRLTSPSSNPPGWPFLHQTHKADQSFIRPIRVASPLSDDSGSFDCWPDWVNISVPIMAIAVFVSILALLYFKSRPPKVTPTVLETENGVSREQMFFRVVKSYQPCFK